MRFIVVKNLSTLVLLLVTMELHIRFVLIYLISIRFLVVILLRTWKLVRLQFVSFVAKLMNLRDMEMGILVAPVVRVVPVLAMVETAAVLAAMVETAAVLAAMVETAAVLAVMVETAVVLAAMVVMAAVLAAMVVMAVMILIHPVVMKIRRLRLMKMIMMAVVVAAAAMEMVAGM